MIFIIIERSECMELTETIEKRRSTREFSTEKIEKQNILDMLECARLAPSAANRQPWYFVVVEGEAKNKIAQIMQAQLDATAKSLDSTENATHAYTATSSVRGSIGVIEQAPILILVLRKRSEDWLEGDYLSIGCAVEHICLKATDLGLGTLWIRDVVYTRDKIAKAIGHEDMELVTGVAVGKSIEYPYERYKKKLDEIMEWV